MWDGFIRGRKATVIPLPGCSLPGGEARGEGGCRAKEEHACCVTVAEVVDGEKHLRDFQGNSDTVKSARQKKIKPKLS